MTRRQAVAGVLASLLTFSPRMARAQGGRLVIDLSQWAGLVVTHKGQSVVLSPEDIMRALKEEPGQ